MPEVFPQLYDSGDLAAEANLNGRRREAERAEPIILDELSYFRAWQRSVATALGVRARAEAIHQSELVGSNAQPRSPRRRAGKFDAVTRSLVRNLLRATMKQSFGDAHVG